MRRPHWLLRSVEIGCCHDYEQSVAWFREAAKQRQEQPSLCTGFAGRPLLPALLHTATSGRIRLLPLRIQQPRSNRSSAGILRGGRTLGEGIQSRTPPRRPAHEDRRQDVGHMSRDSARRLPRDGPAGRRFRRILRVNLRDRPGVASGAGTSALRWIRMALRRPISVWPAVALASVSWRHRARLQRVLDPLVGCRGRPALRHHQPTRYPHAAQDFHLSHLVRRLPAVGPRHGRTLHITALHLTLLLHSDRQPGKHWQHAAESPTTGCRAGRLFHSHASADLSRDGNRPRVRLLDSSVSPQVGNQPRRVASIAVCSNAGGPRGAFCRRAEAASAGHTDRLRGRCRQLSHSLLGPRPVLLRGGLRLRVPRSYDGGPSPH